MPIFVASAFWTSSRSNPELGEKVRDNSLGALIFPQQTAWIRWTLCRLVCGPFDLAPEQICTVKPGQREKKTGG